MADTKNPTVASIGDKGVKVPAALVIRPITVANGEMRVELGFEINAKNKGGVWWETSMVSPSTAEGIKQIVNDLKEESSVTDPDSPGELTLMEAAKVLGRFIMGKF